MMDDVFKKYNLNVPRYTSFPSLPFWQKTPTEREWLEEFAKSYPRQDGIDIYIHVPFCEKLCFYCGCNRTITKDHSIEDRFVQMILNEWHIYEKFVGHKININSLHIGGGTPTFLSPKSLEKILSSFSKASHFMGSVEVDPRTCTLDHLKVFSHFSIKRISLGIQDFNVKVQKQINRIQPFSMVEKLMHKLRSLRFESVNFDIIYGLPGQNEKTIDETFLAVNSLSPDLVSFYSYAHLPQKIKNQKLISEKNLPQGIQKNELYLRGQHHLENEGFHKIGIDHFAKASNYLFKAHHKKKLYRNFMGYTDLKSDILIGLGPTAISESPLGYIQNMKNDKDYEKCIQQKKIPLLRGHHLSDEDRHYKKMILNIMCHQRIEKEDLLEMSPFFGDKFMNNNLAELMTDGLLQEYEDHYLLTKKGRTFSRYISASLDPYWQRAQENQTFSQSI